ncbi:MAG: GLPGLI family protein [Flavobacteriaceae bacterium]|nr:GLPGLI family protein [Flavobacteriaceae bacterium]
MKKTLTILSLLIATTITAQSFQGKAIYKTSRKMDLKLDGNENTMSDERKAQMRAMIAKQFQKTFILTFDKVSSIYKIDKSLNQPKVRPANGMNVMVQVVGDGGGNDVYYKNTKENRFANKTEIMGKDFLIKDKLPKLDWKLTSETKNIGVYTCYKATYTRQEDRTTMTVEDGELKEKKQKVDVVTTAWYTPQISVSNGPRHYHGLPGLILEVKEGNETIICSEIVLNPKEKIKIKEPTKGKKVTQAKYEEIMRKKSKEMMERFRTRRNSKGNNVEIRIGG